MRILPRLFIFLQALSCRRLSFFKNDCTMLIPCEKEFRAFEKSLSLPPFCSCLYTGLMADAGNENLIGKKLIHLETRQPKRVRFSPPLLPEESWCDFRKDYESGMTLAKIGEKYFCDPRTVKSCIMLNKPSAALGKHSVPTKLAPFYRTIDLELERHTSHLPYSQQNISAVTHSIFLKIREDGYDGYERTLRNYIVAKSSPKAILREEERND